MSAKVDLDNLPPFPRRIPEKLKGIRDHLGMTPDQLAAFVGAKTGAEILAYDKDDLLVSVLFGYAKLAAIPGEPAARCSRLVAWAAPKLKWQNAKVEATEARTLAALCEEKGT